MRLAEVARRARRHRSVVVLAGAALLLVGVDLLLSPPKGAWLGAFGLPFVLAGLGLLALVLWQAGPIVATERPTLAAALLARLTANGRLVPFFPLAGVVVLAADVAFNAFLSATPGVGTQDSIVLLLGGMLLAYPYIPPRWTRERDFAFLFLLVLNLLLTVPLLVLRALSLDFERSVDVYSWAVLGPPVEFLLNALGVPTRLFAMPGETAPALRFAPLASGVPIVVLITAACSGIYSFGIFSSAFSAFVTTETRRVDGRVLAMLGFGIAAAYVANLLRIVAIVLIGYYAETTQTALQDMLVAESNLGWIVFLAWISLFWLLVVRVFGGRRKAARPAAPRTPRPVTRCAVCQDVLTPGIPAVRCACGGFYHRHCLPPEGTCLLCLATIEPPPTDGVAGSA
jgi:archaeosortase C (PEF-CTERM variant)